MRVLVTGAGGFIGSHVVDTAKSRGHDVRAVLRPGESTARLRRVPARSDVIECDLIHEPDVAPLLAGWRPDACIHLAWAVDPRSYLDSIENIRHLDAGIRLFHGLIAAGCRRILGVGTCAEYAAALHPVNETAPTAPATLYAACKLSLGLIGEQLAALRDAPFAWSRLFNLYGPGEDERRLVPAVIRTLADGRRFAATEGDQIRDYLHVADVASALVVVAESSLTGAVNICSGTPVAIRSLLETIGELMQRSDLIDFGAVRRRDSEVDYVCGDNSLLQSLGWKAKFDLESGLADTISAVAQPITRP